MKTMWMKSDRKGRIGRELRLAMKWLVPVLVVTGLLGAAVLAALATEPEPAAADTYVRLYCDDNPTTREEGQDFTLHARGHDHSGTWVVAWFYTHDDEADSGDYEEQYAVRKSARHNRNIVNTVETRDDNYPEYDEDFSVSIGNLGNTSNATSCNLTITDDDGNGITKLSMESTPEHEEGYRIGEEIIVNALFKEDVEISGRVVLSLRVGDEGTDVSNYRSAEYKSGSGTRNVKFSYTVKPGDSDSDGISVTSGGNSSGIGGDGSIVDESSGDAVNRWYRGLGDQEGHEVDGGVYGEEVVFVSTPANGYGYVADEEFQIALKFNQPVELRDGTSVLSLRVGESDTYRGARYSEGSGTDTLTYSYTIQDTDIDYDGIRFQAAYWSTGSDRPVGYGGDGKIYAVGGSVAVYPPFEAQEGGAAQAIGIEPVTLVGENYSPHDIFVNDTYYYVLDYDVQYVYAYNLSDGSYDEDASIDVSDYQSAPTGIWSDGETLWVSELRRQNIFAYSLEDGTREEDLDINVHPEGDDIDITVDASGVLNQGIWSDGETIWVLRAEDDFELHAFNLATGAYSSSKSVTPIADPEVLESTDFTTYTGEVILDFWMDSEFVWMPLPSGSLFAHSREDNSYQSDKSIHNLPQGYHWILGFWVEEDYIWGITTDWPEVSVETVLKFKKPAQIEAGAGSIRSTGIKIVSTPEDGLSYQTDEKARIALSFNRPVELRGDLSVSLRLGEGDDSETQRIAPYVEGSGTSTLFFEYEIEETDGDSDGISLVSGGYSGDGRIYAIPGNVGVLPSYRGSGNLIDHAVGVKTIELADGNDYPWGIYADDSHFWIVDSDDYKVYAYNKSDYSHNSDRDIDLSGEFGRDKEARRPRDLWSNGSTLWVGSQYQSKIYAYSLADGERLSTSDITLRENYGSDWGMWGDGTYLWIIRSEPFEIEAYQLSDGERVPSLDLVPEPDDQHLSQFGYNGYFGGTVLDFWLDGTTLWIPHASGEIYAHSYEGLEQQPERTINRTAGRTTNNAYRSIWIDDSGMWAIAPAFTPEESELYVYPLPAEIEVYAGAVTAVDVVSTPVNGDTYRVGEQVLVDVTFSEEVEVVGQPAYSILFGNESDDSETVKDAVYLSGSGTTTLRFSYTVEPGHLADEGLYLYSTSIVGFGEGTIKRPGEDININHTFGGGEAVLTDHKVDARARVTAFEITSTPEFDVGYRAGEAITVELQYDQKVYFSGQVSLNLHIGEGTREASFVSDTNDDSQEDEHTYTTAATFSYTVADEDVDSDGIGVGTVVVDDGNYYGTAAPDLDVISSFTGMEENQAGHMVEQGVSIQSIALQGAGGLFGIGSGVPVQVTFSETVTITGKPKITINIGDQSREAEYVAPPSGVASATAVFFYPVVEGDEDTDGVSVDAGTIDLNDGTMVDSDGNPVALDHDGVAIAASHIVDGVRPTFDSAEVKEGGTEVSVTFSETVKLSSILVMISRTVDIEIEKFLIAVTDITVDGRLVVPTGAELDDETLTFDLETAVAAGQTVMVGYDNIFARDMVGLFIDEAQNALQTFPVQSAVNLSTVEDAPTINSNELVLSASEMTIKEGQTANITVALSAQPTADVTVSLTSQGQMVILSTASLTFTTENWETAQEVTIATLNDTDSINFWEVLTLTASGGGFDGVAPHIRVVISDVDVQGS